MGNPHYWNDPVNGKIMAGVVAEVFGKLAPAQGPLFQANLQQFNERLDRKLAEWTRALAPYRGTKVVTYHKSYDYFLARFGFDLAGRSGATWMPCRK